MAECFANDSTKEKQFYTSIDDSSDEEDSVEQYDIKDKIRHFKDRLSCHRNDNNHYNFSFLLSFIGHAVGIYVLYNPAVQKRYYELKGEKLKQDPGTVQFLNEEEIREYIEGQLKLIEVLAGIRNQHWATSWLEDEDNKKTMNEIFEKIKINWPSLIINDQMSYCRNYHKGVEYHLEHTLETKGLYPDDIPDFNKNFKCPFPLKEKFSRKTLESAEFDLSAVAQINFPVEFLAHLRLHNRSEKRHTRNNEQCKDTSWRIFPLKEVGVKLHNQRDYEYYSTRNERVYLNGYFSAKYSAFFSCQTKIEFSILLKNRLNIKKNLGGMCLSQNILSLWYLLFGCEVIKNPAAIIHNNMVLDLAEAFYVDETKELGYNFKNIIDDMPMSVCKIFTQVMKLNHLYYDFMPYKYCYQYQSLDKNANDLIYREAIVTKRWLELKLGNAVANYLIRRCATDHNAVETIWKLIEESFEKWGLNGYESPCLF